MAALRPATETDLPSITEIYNQAVLRATGTFDTEPKTIEQQRDWFAHHGAAHPVIVAEEGGKIVGWASLSPYSDRCAYARTAEVSVYIDEDARGRGLGGGLLEGILAAGKKTGLLQVLARVTEGNEASPPFFPSPHLEIPSRFEDLHANLGRWWISLERCTR